MKKYNQFLKFLWPKKIDTERPLISILQPRMCKKGVALFISIALLFLLSIGAIVILLVSYNYTNISENQIKRSKAITKAEAVINYAYWKLRIDSTYRNDGTISLTDIDVPGIYENGYALYLTVTDIDPVTGRNTIKSKVVY